MHIHRNLLLVAAIASSSAVPAAAQAAVPVTATPAAPDISVVTVFGRLPNRPSAVVRRLDGSRASSCAFFGSNYYAEKMMDDYLDYFHGRGRSQNDYSGVRDPNCPGGDWSFSDTSPWGDASNPHAGFSGGMNRFASYANVYGAGEITNGSGYRYNHGGSTNYLAAAGRNYIQRKDKTLDKAFAAYDAGDFAKALTTLKSAYSILGYGEAALLLGHMYLYGQGTPRDTQEAIAWYGKVTDALPQSRYPNSNLVPTPRVEALLRLSRIYMVGFDVPKDPEKALTLYKKAADLGYSPAQYDLGRMRELGLGGDKDLTAATKLYEKAAGRGYAPAQMALAQMYWAGNGVPKDMESAFSWYGKAASNPVPHSQKPYAQLALAEMYDKGIGTKADPDKALVYYKVAAVAGHPDAQNALATYFYTGQIVKQDLPLGRKLFISAASQGQPDAMVNTAAMMAKGEGGGQDLVQAYLWLRLAAKLGNSQAQASTKALEEQLTPEQRAKAELALAPRPAS